MGLQPPKPQLAAQSAFLEECEGLLMVTPSARLREGAGDHTGPSLFIFLLSFFFFFPSFRPSLFPDAHATHTNSLANKHVDPGA